MEEHQTLKAFLGTTGRESLAMMKKVTPAKILLLVLYATLLFPFVRQMLKVYFLNKLLIPVFILTYLTNRLLFALLFAVLSLLIFWLGIRLLFVLPQILFYDKDIKEAIAYSWAKTKKRFWSYLWAFLQIVLKTVALYVLACVCLLLIQF